MTPFERRNRRKRQIARNEARFREVDDGRATRTTDFVCECGDPDCTETVALRDEEYELVRSDPLLFAVVPGHEIPDVEDVVAENQRFYVVRKHVAEELLAREAEPRL